MVVLLAGAACKICDLTQRLIFDPKTRIYRVSDKMTAVPAASLLYFVI